MDPPTLAKIQILTDGNWYDVPGNKPLSRLKGTQARFRALQRSGRGYIPISATWYSSGGETSTGSEYTVNLNKTSRSIDDTKGVTAVATKTLSQTIVVGEIGLDSVDFADNLHVVRDGGGDYPFQQEWQSGETPSPLCYVGGKRIKARAFFWVIPGGFDVRQIKVQGKATGTTPDDRAQFTFPEQHLVHNGGAGLYPPTATTTAMNTTCNIFDPLHISWQVSLNDKWQEVGASGNKLYRTLGEPDCLIETALSIGCRNASGASSPILVGNGIWNEFSDRVVKRVDGTPGTGMTYWGPKANVNGNPAFCFSTEGLLKEGDARCGAWQDFMADTLRAQGKDVANGFSTVTINPPTPSGPNVGGPFTDRVKNPDGTFSEVEYYNYYDGHTDYNFVPYIKVNTRASQGGKAGTDTFSNHALLQKGSTIYDPSYGRMSVNRSTYEKDSIEKFFWLDIKTGKPLSDYNRSPGQDGVHLTWKGLAPVNK